MRGFRRSMTVAMMLGALVALGIAGTAGAQSYGSTLSATVENCSRLTVSGSDWRPGDPITITLAPGSVALGAVVADANGAFTADFTLSKSLGDGPKVVTASGPGTPAPETTTPEPASSSVGVKLTGCTASGALATTGSDSIPWAVVGVGLVLVGAVFSVLAFRRRSAHSLGV